MLNNKTLTVFTFLVFYTSLVTAQNTINVKSPEIQYIGKSIAVYEHHSKRDLSINTIDTINFNPQISTSEVLRLGESDSYFWLKFKIKNCTDASLQLSIDQALINFLKLYKKVENNKFISTELGEHLPFDQRNYKHPVYIFDLNLKKGDAATFYLQIKSDESNTLPIAISSKQELQSYLTNKDLFIGCFLGLILVMFLYNLMLYIKIKDTSYVYYILYLITIGLTQLSVQGYTYKYLWPNYPIIAQNNTIYLACFTAVFALFFVQSFLKTKTTNLRFHNAINVLSISFVIPILFLSFGNFYWAFNSMSILAALITLLILFVAYYYVYKGYTPALNFALGWTFLLLFTVCFVLRDIGVLPHNFLTFNGVIIGSSLEAIFLSFALADRINSYRDDLLKTTIEKEEILKRQNAKLEDSVQKRTQEIQLNLTKIEIQNNEKEILLKEIHHRVKNNLQIITSLLSLQNQTIEELRLKQIFTSSQMRIKSMAIIHEILYQSDNFSIINYQKYLNNLIDSLLKSYAGPEQKISSSVKAEGIQFNLETAIPLGLMMNEVITNSIKHGFNGRKSGHITIEITQINLKTYGMSIADDGNGFKIQETKKKKQTLGTKLITKLMRQLNGTVKLETSSSGTTYYCDFETIS